MIVEIPDFKVAHRFYIHVYTNEDMDSTWATLAGVQATLADWLKRHPDGFYIVERERTHLDHNLYLFELCFEHRENAMLFKLQWSDRDHPLAQDTNSFTTMWWSIKKR